MASRYGTLRGPEHAGARIEIPTEILDLGVRTGDRQSELELRLRLLSAQLVRGKFEVTDAAIEAYPHRAEELRSPQGALYSAALPTTRAFMKGDYGGPHRRNQPMRGGMAVSCVQ